MTTNVTLHGPGELLATIEQLLGFEPRESLVVAAIRDRGELGLLMRVDRVDCMVPDVAAPMARAIASHLARDSAVHAVMVTYSEADVRLSCPAADEMRPWLQPGVQRLDHWAVRDGRYFSPGCADDECCPPSGLPIPPAPVPVDSAPALQSVGHGVRAPMTRADADARRRAGRAASRWWASRDPHPEKWRLRSGDKWAAALEAAALGGPLPSPPQAGALVGALRDPRVRDAVVMMLAPDGDVAAHALLRGKGDAEVAQVFDALMTPPGACAGSPEWVARITELCEHLAAHAAVRRQAPVCTLAAMVWWQCGQPAQSLAWVERALESDEHYRLAELLAAAIRYQCGPTAGPLDASRGEERRN